MLDKKIKLDKSVYGMSRNLDPYQSLVILTGSVIAAKMLLYIHKHGSGSATQMSYEFEVARSAVYKQILKLKSVGIIVRPIFGLTSMFHLNRLHPFYPQLKIILLLVSTNDRFDRRDPSGR